jgi:ribosome-associated translation inhibitor RaiA
MINLQTIGFDVLTEETKNEFKKIFDESFKKIERKLKNAESFRIKLKEYSPGGKVKFSIHVLVSYSGKVLEANASDWDLKRTMHKVFDKIEQEAEHTFHISDQNKRKRE